jgi:hypothetical protein
MSHAERVAAVAAFAPDLPGATPRQVAELLADEVEVAGEVATAVRDLIEPPAPDAAALAALDPPSAVSALRVALGVHAADWTLGALRDALRAEGLAARDAMPAVRAALTGRAHGLPIATIRCLLGADETARRLELALRA